MTILSIFFLVLLPQNSSAHGFLSMPASRNALAWDANTFYCPHCLASGGVGVVSALQPSFPAASPEPPTAAFRHGLCGDDLRADPSERFRRPASTHSPVLAGDYVEGQGIEIHLDITANHKGYHEFYLCDDPAAIEGETGNERGQACLNKHRLVRAAPGPTGLPIDPEHPYRWYMPPAGTGDASDGAVDSSGNAADVASWFRGDSALGTTPAKGKYPGARTQRFRLKYVLPAGVTCARCVLQWYWRTANSCQPSQAYEAAAGISGDGFVRRQRAGWTNGAGMNACGGSSYAEEFWNCADVRIRPRSDGDGGAGGGGGSRRTLG